MPLCFDLDGTLGSFDGGYTLLRQALGSLWGAEPGAAELQACAGSTDWEIVDELHRKRFGAPLPEADFARYESRCLEHFQGAFGPGGRRPVVHRGLVEGLGRLLERHEVWLVSGNVPLVLDFKADCLGVDRRVKRMGSLHGQDRAGLLRRALAQGPAPHLYVGDRPHDHAAAAALGLPFLGVGARVPGSHPCLPEEAGPEALVEAVRTLVG